MSDIASARTVRHPVRMAHLGLGHFHRAHQAWYTQRANAVASVPRSGHGTRDGAGWGIAAFTGRSAAAAESLVAQDGMYTLIERAASGDSALLIESISAAYDGADPAWERTLADPAVAVLTVTVTERGYGPNGAGARIAAGLRARARASGGSAAPIALVSCDNLQGNGEVLRQAVELAIAATHDDGTAAWIADNVSFVSSMVDRITPHTTDDDRSAARALTGYDDAVPVVTEPFSEWILSGEFPGGRPAWHQVGVRFVDDIEPFERRKLWLLNAGHTLLAAVGLPRGFATVADAFADRDCRRRLEELWAEARPMLPFDDGEVDVALGALRTRFANPRILHRLDQIDDGSREKLRQRQVAIMRARMDAGEDPGSASLATVAAWGAARALTLSEALDLLSPGLARRVGAGDSTP
jgi:fructuronate reductase